MIATERLVLRPYDADEARAVVTGDHPGRRWADGFPREDDKDVARGFLAAPAPEPLFGPHQMVHRETGLVIGALGFRAPPDGDGALNLGYGLVPEFEGRGLMTEAVRALLAAAFVHPSVRRVVAATTPDHAASRRVMEKAGLSWQSSGNGLCTYALDAHHPVP